MLYISGKISFLLSQPPKAILQHGRPKVKLWKLLKVDVSILEAFSANQQLCRSTKQLLSVRSN